MNRRNMLAISAAGLLGLTLLVGDAIAAPKAKINKNQLVGDWTLVSDNATNAVIQNHPGDGYLSIERNGRFALLLLSSDIPKFASNNRNSGTADENKAVVQGSISYFGTYSLNESDGTLTFHIERCSYPNWNGTDQKRMVTSLNAQELKYTNPMPSIGGTVEFVWKKMK